MSQKTVYEVDLRSPHEKVKLGYYTGLGQHCAVLVRFGRPVTSFLASPGQVDKIRKKSGRIRIMQRQIQGAHGICPRVGLRGASTRKRRRK